jgi:hypothetical protein
MKVVEVGGFAANLNHNNKHNAPSCRAKRSVVETSPLKKQAVDRSVVETSPLKKQAVDRSVVETSPLKKQAVDRSVVETSPAKTGGY